MGGTQNIEETADAAGGIYVYAVVSGDGTTDYGSIGLDNSPVYRLGDRELAAIVSRISRARVRPERRNITAHNAVLRRAITGTQGQGEDAVLPMAFGLIADDDQAVHVLLEKDRPALLAQLARVAGKVELGLRVVWDVPNVFEYFVNRRPELRDARDAIGDIRLARPSDMLTLGQLFERGLIEERERHFERVAGVLRRSGLEIKQNPPRSEREVMHLACLVPRGLQNEFESIVNEAAAEFDNHFTFDISGPWAPHNFVELKPRR
jgi:hypothetical protein